MSRVVVEFIGKPGSGKTTAALELISRVADEGIDVVHNDEGSTQTEALLETSRLKRNLNRFASIASRPVLAVSLAARSTSRPKAAEMWRLATRELRVRKLASIAHDLVVVDEGPLHKLCTIYAEDSVARPLGLLGRLTLPTVCFDLRVDAQVAMERIRGRASGSPVDLKADSELIAYLRRYQECEDVILARHEGKVLSVDAAGPDVVAPMVHALRDVLSKGI